MYTSSLYYRTSFSKLVTLTVAALIKTSFIILKVGKEYSLLYTLGLLHL
jgi:hypothetical protein